MLDEIRIRNFKCLRDTGVLKIRPLTILIGPNSSGKSSLIQFLLMIRQTLASRDYESPLIFNGPCIQLESYRNIIWRNDPEQNLAFEFSLTPIRQVSALKRHMKLTISFRKAKAGLSVRMNSLTIMDRESDKDLVSIKWKTQTPSFSSSILDKDSSRLLIKNFLLLNFLPFFMRPSVEELRKSGKYENWVVDSLNATRYSNLPFSERHMYYLGPLREFPARYYPYSAATLIDTGFKGERSIEVLGSSKKLGDRVDHWMRKLQLAKHTGIKYLRRKTLAELRLTDPKLGISVNICDTGFGISQILPIIVTGFYATSGSMFLVEQPEIHLHPRLQADTGDLLIEISKARKTLIVETHSEHLLLRIQRRIAEGTLNHKDVAIYYFEPSVDGTQITRMKIEETGKIENWPKGFFEEGFREAMAITKANMKRAENRP